MAELRPKASAGNGSSRKHTKSPQSATLNLKCVVLGDGDVGKTCMLLTYLSGHFPEETSPGPMDSLSEYDHLTKHPVTLSHENTQLQLTLVDTYGQDEYDRLRERIGSYADVYVLCYDVSRPLSFERIKHHWLPEFRRYSAPDTPFVVVGLKTDIRSKAMASGEQVKDDSSFVSYGDALRSSEQMGAAQYVECCARNNTGVKRVMEKIAEVAAMNNLPADLKRSSCVLS